MNRAGPNKIGKENMSIFGKGKKMEEQANADNTVKVNFEQAAQDAAANDVQANAGENSVAEGSVKAGGSDGIETSANAGEAEVGDAANSDTSAANSDAFAADGDAFATDAALAAELEKSRKEAADLLNDLQRTRADLENFRKCSEKQKEHAMKIEREKTVLKFLPLIDNFERALSSYPDQLGVLEKTFNETLAKLNLTKINSEVGTEFNPEIHNAVLFEEGEGDDEVIVETLTTGYYYDGSVIRAAMVKVQR